MTDLYYIENVGCDDLTRGLAIIPEEHFAVFKNIITDLNKNSTCQCMPIIEVYKIDETMIREATEEDADYRILHLGDKKYVLKDALHNLYDDKEAKVI